MVAEADPAAPRGAIIGKSQLMRSKDTTVERFQIMCQVARAGLCRPGAVYIRRHKSPPHLSLANPETTLS